MESVLDRVRRWDSSDTRIGTGNRFSALKKRIDYLDQKLYHEYSAGPANGLMFEDRLEVWLNGVNDQQQRKLLQLIPKIFFMGHTDQNALSVAAFRGPILRWLIDRAGLDWFAEDFEAKLDVLLPSVWFCPITDSMNLNSFLKVNDLSGHLAPITWMGSYPIIKEATEAVANHLNSHKVKGMPTPIQYIVLLEDFVGSGNQSKIAFEMRKVLPETIFVLIVPLVCCQSGAKFGARLAQGIPNTWFEPVLTLDPTLGIGATPLPGEDPLFASIRAIASSLSSQKTVRGNPFGFSKEGTLYVSHSNCPNNAPPLLHEARDADWKPLFPRVSRT